MELTKKINLAAEISEHIISHITGIWPGFLPVPFILYDDNNQVAIGAEWPERYTKVQENIWTAEGADPQLMGNSSIMYHGRQVAIWDMRTWSDEPDKAEAAAGIAHEMFHAFQHASLKLPMSNELLLPNYPHTIRSIALVIEENKAFEQIITSTNPVRIHEYLKKITGLRYQREREIGTEYMEYDKRVESLEGTAAYVEVRMKAVLRNETPPESAASYRLMLTQDDRLLIHHRLRCYTTGLFLCLAADTLCPGWQTEWSQAEQPLFDWLRKKLEMTETEETPDQTSIQTAAKLMGAYQNEKEKCILDFTAQPLTLFEEGIELLAFDPMNLICIGDLCLHKHGKVRLGKTEHLLEKPFLEEFKGTILKPKRIWIQKGEANGTVHH